MIENGNLSIRKAEMDDLDAVMAVYRVAQEAMISAGNPAQWGYCYPTRELICDDIAQRRCHLLCDREGIRGAFVLCEGEDPTYQKIENGRWLNDEPYVTVHRLASDGRKQGIFACTMEYCRNKYDNIRIDTHADNRKMQSLLARSGFVPCGTIYTHDGTARLAYQWIKRTGGMRTSAADPGKTLQFTATPPACSDNRE